MRTAAAATALGLTLIVAAGLAACSPDDPVRPPDPGPSRTPVFASEEEALAAAEEAYREYLAVANAVAQDGGADPERYKSVVTQSWLEHEIEFASELREAGNRQFGDVTFTPLSLQSADLSSADVAVSAYTCLDVSGTRLVDTAGVDVTPTDRDLVVPIEVVFRASKAGLSDGSNRVPRLLIEGSDLWTGQDFC